MFQGRLAVSSKPRKKPRLKLKSTAPNARNSSRISSPRYVARQFHPFVNFFKFSCLRFHNGECFNLSVLPPQHLGSRDDVAAKIDTDMRSKMVGIDACMSANKEQVIQQIIKYIYEIKPAIHKNIRVD